jgi:outer membrane biosynthesis protein TonB
MANWEYKVISSGKHGMATMAALEQHLNDLGQQQWEIVNWHTAPDNPLLFTGLARRPILRDWKPDEMPAAQEAARAEKTEDSKERDAWRATLKEELEFITDRQDDEGDAEADAEDMFEVLRPLMKRSLRGPGSVGSLSFLARKLEQDENDLLGALAEAGLPLVDDPKAVPPALKHEDEFFWLNKNARGEIWLNSGPKAPAPKPVFEPRPERQPPPRLVRQPEPADETATEQGAEVRPAEPAPERQPETRAERQPEAAPARQPEPRAERQPSQRQPDARSERQPSSRQPQRQPRQPQDPRDLAPTGERGGQAGNGGADSGRATDNRGQRAQRDGAAASGSQAAALPEGEALLLKLRPMMRRNRRGRGWSGSTSFLSRALRLQEADLMAAFAKVGLVLGEDPQGKPVFVELNGMLYWLNGGQGGQVWINAREQRPGEAHSTGEEDEGPSNGASASVSAPAPTPAAEAPVAHAGSLPEAPVPAEPVPVAEAAAEPAPAPEPVSTSPTAPVAETEVVPSEISPAPAGGGDYSVFARIRPHFTKNKRSLAFSAAPSALAEVLAVSQADLLDTLVKAGLSVPTSDEDKPVFAEHAGEIFWFNRNSKAELWLNAKAKPVRKPAAPRSRKSAE